MFSCIDNIGRQPEHANRRTCRVKHLDAARFEQQAGGNPALMVRVAQAFLGQLPSWRAELTATRGEQKKLTDLLHKMKGSCQAITATEAAKAFAQAEQALKSPAPQTDITLSGLLTLVTEIETELIALIKQHDRAAP